LAVATAAAVVAVDMPAPALAAAAAAVAALMVVLDVAAMVRAGHADQVDHRTAELTERGPSNEKKGGTSRLFLCLSQGQYTPM
jgi:hypothetical protein